MSKHFSPKDWQLLSEYLDGQLSKNERNRVEILLKENLEYQEAYQSLLRTRQVLRSLKTLTAPRNFTLTEEYAIFKPRKPLFSAMRLATVLASFLLVLTFVSQGFLDRFMAKSAAPMAAMMGDAMNSEHPANTPLIITWGTPTPKGYMSGLGYGKGGGGADNLIQQYSAPEELTQLPEAETSTLEEEPTDGALMMQSIPSESSTPSSEATIESNAQSRESPTLKQNLSTNPILGVPSFEEQGMIISSSPTAPELSVSRWSTIKSVQASLAVIVVLAGLLTAIFYWKEKL